MLKQIVNRHWVPFVLGAASVGLFLGSFLLIGQEAQNKDGADNMETQTVQPDSTEVLLETVFADGQIRQERVVETIWAMEDFWSEYEEWQLVDQARGFVHFRQEIVDLSPSIKQNGYIGLTDDMEVALFTGHPKEMSVVNVYSNLNVSDMSENQLQELEKGIQIIDLQMLNDTLEQLQ